MWVEKLEVSDVAEGAANVNVQGRREVSALQGFGKLWQKTYRGAFGRGRINAGLGREGLEGAHPRVPAAEQPVLPVEGGRRAREISVHLRLRGRHAGVYGCPRDRRET